MSTANVKTKAYCDIDRFSQKVLYNLMKRKLIDKGPIFNDITELKGSDLPWSVDCISSGFPCQGISSMGKRLGFQDERTQLVNHVFRLIDECDPTYIQLENVAAIIKTEGYENLLGELVHRGYRCAFMTLSAAQVGAAHSRKRWFLLGVKNHKNGKVLRVSSSKIATLKSHFKQKVHHKLVPRSNASATSFCKGLGNAVVPAQAAESLKVLNDTLNQSTDAMPMVSLKSMSRKYPVVVETDDSGQLVFFQNISYVVPDPSCKSETFTVHAPTDSLGSPKTQRVTASRSGLKCIPTPRTGSNCSVPAASMTERSLRDSGTFLVNSRELWSQGDIQSSPERRKRMVSSHYLAATMGFPMEWLDDSLS